MIRWSSDGETFETGPAKPERMTTLSNVVRLPATIALKAYGHAVSISRFEALPGASSSVPQSLIEHTLGIKVPDQCEEVPERVRAR